MRITAADLKRFSTDPAAFRASLMVDTEDGAVPFAPDPWQQSDFAELDKVWMRALGKLKDGGPTRAWVGRSRGHSKTTDEAVEIMWVLAFSPRAVSGIVAAASREQAQILRDRIQTLVMLNPWLSDVLDIQNYKVLNCRKESPAFRSVLDIISTDAPSQYGQIVDFIICDELTHWKDDELWQAVSTTAGKRKTCALIIMTNAGFVNTWQWGLFQTFQAAKDLWVVIHHDGPQASWITEAMLDEQRTMISKRAFDRLWMNRWQLESGDALEYSDVQAAIVLGMGALMAPESDWEYVGGLDLSTKKHRSALVVLGANRDKQRVRLAYSKSWKPGADGKVPLDEIRSHLIEISRRFRCERICYDNYQAELMAADARLAGVRMEEMSFQSGKNCDLMASKILEVFRSRQIDLYDDAELVNGLIRLNIVHKRFGYKLEADENEDTGHADKAFALAIALPAAVELSSIVPIRPFTDRDVITTPEAIHARLAELERLEPTAPTAPRPAEESGQKVTPGFCVECNGTGKYVGLMSVEPCRVCGGLDVRDDAAKALDENNIKLDNDEPDPRERKW